MALGGGEGSKGGGGGEGSKGGGGEGSKGVLSDLAGVDGERGGLLEKGNGCSTSGRQDPLLPERHGILIPCPGAASWTGDGVARRFAPIKIDFSKGGTSAAKGTPGFSKNSAGGLGRGCARNSATEGTPGFSKNSVGKTTAGGLGSRVGCFKGFRILPLGFKKSSEEEISSRIKAHGGQVSSVAEYDTCTHICLGNELNKRLIKDDWISLSHDGEPEGAETNQMVISTSSKPRQKIAELNPDSRVRRELFPVSPLAVDEEKIRRQHHQLFKCMDDQSDLITFAAFAQSMRRSLIVSDEWPGTNKKVSHTSTLLELKLLCKEAYLLLKALRTAGYTLGGNFSSDNFVLVERVTGRGILFGLLEKGSIQLTSSTGETSDDKCFKRMVISLFPKNVLPPHDLVTWLSLVGRKDMEWLLLNSWTVLEEQDARERFLFWGGKFQELYERDNTSEVYWRVVRRLDEKGYNKWEDKIDADSGNKYLKSTLNFVNTKTNLTQNYPKHVGGLLMLLRNCRHHDAKPVADKFLMIVSDNFPNLLMDFQQEMYTEGFYAL